MVVWYFSHNSANCYSILKKLHLRVDTKARNKPKQPESSESTRTLPNQPENLSESNRIKPNQAYQAETTRIKPNQPKTHIFGFFHLIRLDSGCSRF